MTRQVTGKVIKELVETRRREKSGQRNRQCLEMRENGRQM